MKTILAVALACALAACQTTKPTVVTGGVDSVLVNKPVVQPCIDSSKIKAIPPSAMPPRGADVDALSSGAYVDAWNYRELAREQNDLLVGCSKVTKP